MSETRNIVIVGASFAGLSAAHYFLKHTYPLLHASSKETKYVVHLIDPSTHFWWRPAAPREMVDAVRLPHKSAFVSKANGFKVYPDGLYEFHQGEATSVDTTARTVTFTNSATEQPETLQYYSLVIATGTRTPTPLTSLHGDHQKSIEALDAMNKKLASPDVKTVIISGGGPTAVESAGEIGEKLNGKNVVAGKQKVQITLVVGGSKLLPVLPQKLADKAQKHLAKVGVDVVFNARVKSVSLGESPDSGKTTVTLEDGKELTADVYIPGHGVTPNTSFLPKELLDADGYVKTNKATLRVDEAGPRVYSVGDVGNYSRGSILDLFNALPIALGNLSRDLGVVPGNKNNKDDKMYEDKVDKTQMVPIGLGGGVGAWNGSGVPQLMVKMIKGKDYMVRYIPDIVDGKKWKKA